MTAAVTAGLRRACLLTAAVLLASACSSGPAAVARTVCVRRTPGFAGLFRPDRRA